MWYSQTNIQKNLLTFAWKNLKTIWFFQYIVQMKVKYKCLSPFSFFPQSLSRKPLHSWHNMYITMMPVRFNFLFPVHTHFLTSVFLTQLVLSRRSRFYRHSSFSVCAIPWNPYLRRCRIASHDFELFRLITSIPVDELVVYRTKCLGAPKRIASCAHCFLRWTPLWTF